MSWWHFWKGFISSKAVEKQDGGSSRAHGTYMISVRLQLLPTGLISMLSYFLGLMYSEVVLAHLQLRFPFTSRMAEREREGGDLQAQTAPLGMQQLREPKEVSLPVFSLTALQGPR